MKLTILNFAPPPLRFYDSVSFSVACAGTLTRCMSNCRFDIVWATNIDAYMRLYSLVWGIAYTAVYGVQLSSDATYARVFKPDESCISSMKNI